MLLVAPPARGRVYSHAACAGLADVAPDGRARLDAIALWLQDAAWADVQDAGVDDDGVWVVRRTHVRVERFPRFGEALELATFCSGTGTLWAERRTTLHGEDGAHAEAGALWVHLDPTGARPRPLPEGFDAVYGAAAGGRRVKARLTHPLDPPGGAAVRPWAFRAADLDLAHHVNNSVYWAILEEELAGVGATEPLTAEIEHRGPADAGPAEVLSASEWRWIAQPAGTVVASARLG